MLLPQPLIHGILIKRYKRFLADVRLDNGEIVTAHSPNTGSMKGCNIPGSPVILSRSDNPKRKLPYTWELVKVGNAWVCVNTTYPNRIVKEAIEAGGIAELRDYRQLHTEVPYSGNSRIDILLKYSAQNCYVEVKNVTLAEAGTARFPDAVTTRGQKHLQDLMAMVVSGQRGVIFFVINRADTDRFAPADDIDPRYGELLREAARAGVEILAYQTRITPPEIVLSHALPVVL
ncbi:MAG: DNA/RNA nuclease SfsA [Calditrichaeota bacterium]|nr:DNA/RNA nuclease SfsA [Calditrichota bacterium]